MIINLFSSFDPCTGLISLNWLSSIIILLLINYNFWTTKNNISNLFIIIIINLHLELKIIIPIKGFSIFPLRLILIIFLNNLLGLLPYVFTSSSHLIFSLGLSLPLWIRLIIFGWINKTNYILEHIVPIGTPRILMPIIVIIERIRNLIRPGSLAVRLSANIIAGHLLISLLGSRTRPIFIIIFILIFIILLIFEIAVRIIQSYVFITLITLYSREV